VANRQNRLEWVLLSATYWADFATSSLRQTRLATVNQLAYQYGILTGADVPIAERQQHGWYMVDTSGTIEQQYQRIAARIDWYVSIGRHLS
jgi:phosphoserine phosphatase